MCVAYLCVAIMKCMLQQVSILPGLPVGANGLTKGLIFFFNPPVSQGVVRRRCGSNGFWETEDSGQVWRDMTQCEEEKEVTNQEVERLQFIQLGGYIFWNPHRIVETVFNALWWYETVICEDGLWRCGFVFTAVVQATDGELPDVVYCRLFFVFLHASDSSYHSAELSVSWITGQITCCMISRYQLDTPPKIFNIHNNFILLLY